MKKSLLPLFAAFTLFGSIASINAQDKSSRFQTIPADSIAIVSVDLEAVKKIKELEFVPWEILSVGSKEQMGVDVLLAKSVDVAIGMPGPSGPEFGASIMTSEDVDIADLTIPDLKEVQTSPRRADLRFREMNYSPVRFAQQSSKQMYMGTDGMLRRMLATKSASSPALKIASETKEPVFAVLALEPIRPILIGFLEDNPTQLPEPLLDPLMTLAEEVDNIRLTSTPGFNSKLTLDLFSESKESVTKIASALKSVQTVGFEMIESQMRESMSQGPGVSPEMMAAVDAYAVRIKTLLNEGFWTEHDDRLSVSVDSNGTAALGVAVGMLLPAVQAARAAAQRMSSSNNMKQILLAKLNYESAYKRFPGRVWKRDAEKKPLLSWRVAILPYVEENVLYQEFRQDEPWDSPHNIKLLERMPPVFRNPQIPTEVGYTTYVIPYGEGTAGSVEKGIQFAMMTDGSSNTIAVVEVDSGYAVPWTAPDDISIDETDLNDAFPPRGSTVGFFDGSVQFVSKFVDLEILEKMLTYSGGEVVNLP
jgi:hypothetical protein